jgi:hypothetical protein
MEQDVTWKTTVWEIVPNPLFPELRVEHPVSGRWYVAVLFTEFGPANEAGRVYSPAEAQHVSVVETWSGGGRAKVQFNDGFVKEVFFGRRKPGSRGRKKPGNGGFNHGRQRAWRGSRCNDMEQDVTTTQIGSHS